MQTIEGKLQLEDIHTIAAEGAVMVGVRTERPSDGEQRVTVYSLACQTAAHELAEMGCSGTADVGRLAELCRLMAGVEHALGMLHSDDGRASD